MRFIACVVGVSMLVLVGCGGGGSGGGGSSGIGSQGGTGSNAGGSGDAPTVAMGTVAGKVVSLADGAPVPNAMLRAGAVSATSGSDGSFSFRVASAERVVVRVEAPGFAPSIRVSPVAKEKAQSLAVRLVPLGCLSLLPVFRVTTDALPQPIVGQPYAAKLATFGASGAVSWSVAEGVVPHGLQVSVDGAITGTPTSVSHTVFVLAARDASGKVAEQTFVLTVQPAADGTSDGVVSVANAPAAVGGEFVARASMTQVQKPPGPHEPTIIDWYEPLPGECCYYDRLVVTFDDSARVTSVTFIHEGPSLSESVYRYCSNLPESVRTCAGAVVETAKATLTLTNVVLGSTVDQQEPTVTLNGKLTFKW